MKYRNVPEIYNSRIDFGDNPNNDNMAALTLNWYACQRQQKAFGTKLLSPHKFT